MSSVVHMEARFHGSEELFDFVKNNTYQLEIRQGWFGRIHVQPVHGYERKPYQGYFHSFADLHRFLHVWQPLALKCGEARGFYRVEDPR